MRAATQFIHRALTRAIRILPANAVACIGVCLLPTGALSADEPVFSEFSAVSDPFTVDTRLTGSGAWAVSGIFLLDAHVRNTGDWGLTDVFAFETRPAWGVAGASSSIGSFVLDSINGLDVGEFFVQGPAALYSGETANYRAYLRNPSSGVLSDITAQCRFRVAGGRHPNVGIGGSMVLAYAVTDPVVVSLYATYERSDGQVASELLPVSLQPASIRVTAAAAKTDLGGGNFRIDLSATAQGGSGNYNYGWDLDGDGAYDDGTGPETITFPDSYGTHRFGVQATDGVGGSATGMASVTLNKPLVVGQPEREAEGITYDPVFGVGSGNLYDYDRFSIESPVTSFDPSLRSNGLIIIIHGMRETYDGSSSWWPFLMANAIRERFEDLGREAEMPNILVYDWTEYATPSKPDSIYLQGFINGGETALDFLGDVWSLVRSPIDYLSGLALKRFPGGEKIVKVIDSLDPVKLAAEDGVFVSQLMIDTLHVTDIALNHGLILGDWILKNASTTGPIDANAPIHLIGHSAGGFVAGEAALFAGSHGVVIDRVTMLDTPLPWLPHLSLLPDPTYVERIFSSAAGQLQFAEVSQIPYNVDNPFYEFYGVPEVSAGISGYSLADAHRTSREWYHEMIEFYGTPIDQLGYIRSPVELGPMAVKTQTPQEVFAFAESLEEPADPWIGFESYGNVVAVGGERILSESSDAGIYSETELPVGTSRIQFDAAFESLTDGDFLSVSFGPNLLRTVPNLEFVAGQYQTVIIPVARYGGTTDTLVFNLVSRGEANAVAHLKNFQLIENDDIDGDGLSNAMELSMGTDPFSIDTDDDGIPDSAEEPDSDPLFADTDGDGESDLAEIIAGTDPRDGQSVFRVSQYQHDGASFALWWKSVPGKTYRVIWSRTADFTEFEVVAHAVEATGDETSYLDWTKPSSDPEQGFYRLEALSE